MKIMLIHDTHEIWGGAEDYGGECGEGEEQVRQKDAVDNSVGGEVDRPNVEAQERHLEGRHDGGKEERKYDRDVPPFEERRVGRDGAPVHFIQRLLDADERPDKFLAVTFAGLAREHASTAEGPHLADLLCRFHLRVATSA